MHVPIRAGQLLLVAQSMMGITSDRRFLRVARKRLIELFPGLVGQSGLHKRRAQLADSIERVMAALARECPGYYDDIVLIDSTPGGNRPIARDGQACRRLGAR